MSYLEETKRRIAEIRQRNLKTKAKIQKEEELLEQQKKATSTLTEGDITKNPDSVKAMANKIADSHKESINNAKRQIELINQKMNKYKKDNLTEILTATNNYFAPQKEFVSNSVQCDILTGDPKAIVMEQIEAKKKLPKKNKYNKLIENMKKSKFIKNLIESENFREIKEKNERIKADILKNKTKELHEFLSNKTLSLFEEALDTKLLFDTFKSYYNEEDENNLEYKRTWIHNSFDLVDDVLINKRSVTALEFNKKSSDLLLACYSPELGSLSNSNEPNGLMVLHNLVKKKNELVIKHQTEITSACFHQGNPKYIIAGSFTGQILIFDIRVGGSPVLKSPSTGMQHSLPIYSISNYGSENSNHILSISNDGVVCVANMHNFSRAIKKIELKTNEYKKNINNNTVTDEISVICAANNPEGEYVYVGSDDSNIYQVFMGQADENDNIIETYKSHSGPITSISLHPEELNKLNNEYKPFISSSIDFTMKLWLENNNSSPLLTFDSNDNYIYDCRFHPCNPSLFASVDGDSKLDFWDLNKDIECPVYRHEIGRDALNKVNWSDDGKRLAVGDINGKISVMSLDKEFVNAKPEDLSKFQSLLKNSNVDYYKNIYD